MNGEVHWITLVPILIGSVGLGLLFVADWMSERHYRVREAQAHLPTRAARGRRDDRACVARIRKLEVKPA
jgi:hypothetical protein